MYIVLGRQQATVLSSVKKFDVKIQLWISTPDKLNIGIGHWIGITKSFLTVSLCVGVGLINQRGESSSTSVYLIGF